MLDPQDFRNRSEYMAEAIPCALEDGDSKSREDALHRASDAWEDARAGESILEVKLSSQRASVKADSGRIEGYGSTFGNEDLGGDIVVEGAFDDFLATGAKTVMRVLHSEPVGLWDDRSVDRKGLKVGGTPLYEDVPKAREGLALTRAGVFDGLSIGYIVDEYEIDKQGRRLLKALTVPEVSLVDFPMNPNAHITSVKNASTRRQVERILRDAGFSRSQAKGLLARGYEGMNLRDAEPNRDELKAALGGLQDCFK